MILVLLKQANPDLKDRRWGHAAIGWAYGQNKLKSRCII